MEVQKYFYEEFVFFLTDIKTSIFKYFQKIKSSYKIVRIKIIEIGYQCNNLPNISPYT